MQIWSYLEKTQIIPDSPTIPICEGNLKSSIVLDSFHNHMHKEALKSKSGAKEI